MSFKTIYCCELCTQFESLLPLSNLYITGWYINQFDVLYWSKIVGLEMHWEENACHQSIYWSISKCETTMICSPELIVLPRRRSYRLKRGYSSSCIPQKALSKEKEVRGLGQKHLINAFHCHVNSCYVRVTFWSRGRFDCLGTSMLWRGATTVNGTDGGFDALGLPPHNHPIPPRLSRPSSVYTAPGQILDKYFWDRWKRSQIKAIVVD